MKQMKKILSVIILSMLFSAGAGASEIFGQISTNPVDPSGYNLPVVEPIATVPAPVIINQAGAVILPARAGTSAENLPAETSQLKEIKQIAPAVLGAKIYPDGSLLRASDHRIYLIQRQTKKYLGSLRELQAYRGRPILAVTAQDLAGLENRQHLDGELIRQLGDVKVYVIAKGRKRHILNLEELRAHYFGLEIFNISAEEMELY